MGWWLKNRVEIEIMVFLLIGVGLLTGVGLTYTLEGWR
jgi:hypothetical protein